MATKDWKLDKKAHDITGDYFWGKRPNYVVVRKYYKDYQKTGKYETIIGGLNIKETKRIFKTKSQAMAFARAYMSKH